MFTVATIVMGFVLAQISNYVDLTGTISDSAVAFKTNLPLYILAGLGIMVGLVLFRFGIRLLKKWVR